MKRKKVIALLLAATVATSVASITVTNPMIVFAEELPPANTEDLETNTGAISTNTGSIDTNTGSIETNASEGTVETNNGTINTNKGTVTENNAFITTNNSGATVVTNNTSITTNYGTVTNGYGVDGNIKILKTAIDTNVRLDPEVVLEEYTEDNTYYVVPLNTKFTILGVTEFRGKLYRVIIPTPAPSDDGEYTPEELTEVILEEIVEAPPVAMESTSIPGVSIKDWTDVSNVIETMADAIEANEETNVKLFKLSLSDSQRTVPVDVVASLSESSVDGLHCFIGNGDAITT